MPALLDCFSYRHAGDGKLTGLHTVTLSVTVTRHVHDTDLASAENEEVVVGGCNNRDRDRSWTYLPDCFILQHCEVLEYIFSVSMHISPNATAPCTFSTCSMHISAHATAPCTFHRMQLLHAHSAHAIASCTFHHMQLLHAHSAPACTRSGSLHNVLHSSSMSVEQVAALARAHCEKRRTYVRTTYHVRTYASSTVSRHFGAETYKIIVG